MAVYPSFIVDQVHNNPTSNGLSESIFSFPEVVTMKRVSLNISNGSLIQARPYGRAAGSAEQGPQFLGAPSYRSTIH